MGLINESDMRGRNGDEGKAGSRTDPSLINQIKYYFSKEGKDARALVRAHRAELRNPNSPLHINYEKLNAQLRGAPSNKVK